jgi:hypothetical protein
MRLNESLLERAEELFDLITCDESNVELNSAMDSLRRFLENDIDGWTAHCEHDLALATYNRLEEILQLIPYQENRDSDISGYFAEVLCALNSVCDDDELGEEDFDRLDYDEEESAECECAHSL